MEPAQRKSHTSLNNIYFFAIANVFKFKRMIRYLVLISTLILINPVFSQEKKANVYLSVNKIRQNRKFEISINDSTRFNIKKGVLIFEQNYPVSKNINLKIKYKNFNLDFISVFNLFENYDIEFFITTNPIAPKVNSKKIIYSYFLKWYPRLTDKEVSEAKKNGETYTYFQTKPIFVYQD